MHITIEIKMLHLKQFKDGSIKQATFLKSFKKEILELQSMGYKPSEIRGYFEEKLDVSINMNSFYAWLKYTKKKDSVCNNDTTKEITGFVKEPVSSNFDTVKLGNTLDILSSTDFD